MRETSVALAVGGTAWLLGVAAYTAALMARGRSDLTLMLLYNAPVAFLFLALLISGLVAGVILATTLVVLNRRRF